MHANKKQQLLQEETSKHRLTNLELEEPPAPHYYPHRKQPPQHDQHSISDWTNHHELPPPPQSSQQHPAEHDHTRFTFFSTKRYQSSLLSPKNNKSTRLELSPIVVKFNAKVLSHNLQRSREKYMRKLKEDPYMSHY